MKLLRTENKFLRDQLQIKNSNENRKSTQTDLKAALAEGSGNFLVAKTQLYKMLGSPSVRWSVLRCVSPSIGPLVCKHKSKSGKTSVLDAFFMCVSGRGHGVQIGVGCPCPPVRNDIVTPCFIWLLIWSSLRTYQWSI